MQTVEVKAETIRFNEITGKEEIFTQLGEVKYYQYIAEKDGKYAFELSGENISGYYSDYYGTSIDQYFSSRIFDLQADDSVWIKVRNNSDEIETNPFTLTVRETEPVTVTISGTVNETYPLIGQEDRYFEYTAKEDGVYNVSINHSNFNISYNYDGGSNYNGRISTEYSFGLTEGQTLFLKLHNDGDSKTDCTLKVEKVETDLMNVLDIGTRATLNFTTYGQTEWRAVLIEEDGDYTITAGCTDSIGDFYVEGIEPHKTTRVNPYNGSSRDIDMYNLSAGTTIYIKVYPYNFAHISNPELTYEHNINITVTKN